MLWVTYLSYQFAFDYIKAQESATTELALVVAAVLTPISGLQAALLKFYAQHKYQDETVINARGNISLGQKPPSHESNPNQPQVNYPPPAPFKED